MMFLRSIILLFFVVNSLARFNFGRRPAPPGRQHREMAHRCITRQQQPLEEPESFDTPDLLDGARRQDAPTEEHETLVLSGGVFKQDVIYKGDDFFSQWNFFSALDPTHGLVNYQSQDDARLKHLAYVDNGVTVLEADSQSVLQPGQKRDSVRISSKKTWNGGLFIADFAHMPVGCSIWPAYWSLGPDWPNGGEIDVVEGVHNQITNQYTLHTSKGCTASSGTIQITGKPGRTTQCATIGTDNTGCAYHDTDARSYGQGFNSVGGGVFAHLWDQTGIKVWHFSRNEIPENIQSESPDPNTWGPPAAFWSSDTCDIGQHFHDHALVIDTTFCGDWAGATFASAGCSGTCEQAVADPRNFKDAQWKINFIAVYQPA